MGKQFILLLLCLGVFIEAKSQYGSKENQIDSLLFELKQSPRDSSRSPILVNLWRAYINNDVERALDYADSLIALGRELDNISIKATGNQRKGIAYYYLDNLEESNVYYKKTLALSQSAGETSTTAAMQLNIGVNFKKLGVQDSALYFVRQAQDNFKKAEDTLGMGSCFQALSGIWDSKGYYQLSLETALKASRIFEEQKDTLGWSDASSAVALNYVRLRDTSSAERYFQESIKLYERMNDKHFQGYALSSLASLWLKDSSKQTEAERLLQKSIALAEEVNAPFYQIKALLAMGSLYYEQERYSLAEKITRRSLFLADSTKNFKQQAQALIQLAEVDLAQNNWTTAKNRIEQALSIKGLTLTLEIRSKAALLLSKAASLENKPEDALMFYQQHKQYNDSVYDAVTTNANTELKVIYETQRKEAALAVQEEKIKTLNEKSRADRLSMSLFGGAAVFFIALSGALYFGFTQRMRKNKVEREKQEELYLKEIEHKKKELASQTLHLVQKNTFIQELMENLQSIKNDPEKFKVEFRRMVMLLKKENASDKDWEVFKTYFAEVHNDFDQKLRSLYNDISEKEIRLAAFLRMNLTTKEIAATLNVLPDSILKSKYRLKKKLGLDKETDLTGFLNSI